MGMCGTKLHRVMVIAVACLCLAIESRGAWTPSDGYGGINANLNEDAQAAVIASYDDEPYVIWSESDGTNDQIYVKTYNGSDWNQLGGSLNVQSSYAAGHPDLVFTQAGVPVAAWDEEDASGATQVYVKTYNGTDWAVAQGALNMDVNRNAERPSLAVDGNSVYVTWQEEDPSAVKQIYVKTMDLSMIWSQVGSTSLNMNPSVNGENPRITVLGGTPYVAWSENNGMAQQIYVKALNGSTWEQIGLISLNNSPSNNAYRPDITSNGGMPYVTWTETTGGYDQIFAKYFSFMSPAWSPMGGSLNMDNYENADHPSIHFFGSTPYVAWQESSGATNRIYAKYYAASSWYPAGSGSLNIASNAEAENPSLSGTADEVYASWQEEAAGVTRIFVKHYVSPSVTDTPTVTATEIHSPTMTPSMTATTTETPFCTVTASPTTDMNTATSSPTQSVTFTCTPSVTASPTKTLSATHSPTHTHTPSFTQTATTTPTPTPSATASPTGTFTPTLLPTLTITPTYTQSATFTTTMTITPTVFQTKTSTVTTTQIPSLQIGEDEVLAGPSPVKGDAVWFYYHAPADSEVEIKLYNVLGESSLTLHQNHAMAGSYRLKWDVRDVAGGIYFYRVTIHSTGTKKTFPIKKIAIIK